MKLKNLCILIICLSVLFSFAPTVPYAQEVNRTVSDVETANIHSYAAKTKWNYKIMDDKLYRRLYDTTNKCWIGNWELCL